LKQGVEQFAMKSINLFISNQEELPEELKKSIFVPVYKKSDTTDCSTYRGISLLLITYKLLYNILLSRLTPYEVEVIGDYQYGFRCNRLNTDHIFCIHSIIEKNGNIIKRCFRNL
jgi:hypothetical protein